MSDDIVADIVESVVGFCQLYKMEILFGAAIITIIVAVVRWKLSMDKQLG